MFRIAAPDETWAWPVTVSVPAGEGEVERQRYTARFRLLGASDAERLARESDEALIRGVLAGWDRIADAAGAPLAYSPEALSQLVEIPYWRRATALAYLEFAAGLPAKNSEPSPGAS